MDFAKKPGLHVTACVLFAASCADRLPMSIDRTPRPTDASMSASTPLANARPYLPPGIKVGVNLPSEVPFPQYILDYAAARRPDVVVPPGSGRPTGYFEADWGEHTIPSASRVRKMQERVGTVEMKVSGLPTVAVAENDHASSSMSMSDTIYVTLSSWIDPDPSQWIYFGSYTYSSAAINYQYVVGYTAIDESPWASLFDERYDGFGANVSLAYPYFTYGGFLFEQTGDHYATHGYPSDVAMFQ